MHRSIEQSGVCLPWEEMLKQRKRKTELINHYAALRNTEKLYQYLNGRMTPSLAAAISVSLKLRMVQYDMIHQSHHQGLNIAIVILTSSPHEGVPSKYLVFDTRKR